MSGPYGQAALTYYSRGWTDVFPVGSDVEPLAKSPVPTGVTGYDAPAVGWTRIKRGTETRAALRNIGIRMPRQVICLDVDEYEDHAGAATLAAAEAHLGPLPATYRSTARGRGDSGHRFYRTGMGRIAIPGAEEILAKAYGPNIEVLHYGRRYALVWPSRNPAAGYATYQWHGPDGQLMDGPPPRVTDLPVLPPAWQELLTAPIDSPAAQRTSGSNLRGAKRNPQAELKAAKEALAKSMINTPSTVYMSDDGRVNGGSLSYGPDSAALADKVRALESEMAATEGDDLFDAGGDAIRRSVAEAHTMDQLRAVLAMRVGTVNKTLGGAGIWFARMANAGLFTLEQARELLVAATEANGVHSDGWNAANRKRWTLDSRLSDAMSQGLNRSAFLIINDFPAADVYGQMAAYIERTRKAASK